MSKEQNKKYVLYLAGGGMAGVFGAGVVSYMQDVNFYPYLKKVYAASAGGLNAAFFLTHNTKIGSSIYYEDLTSNFIFKSNVFPGAIERLKAGPIFPDDPYKYRNAMNIANLFEIVKNKKVLDVQGLQKQPIEFCIKVYNQSEDKLECLDARAGNTLELLEATCCYPPYTFEHKVVNGSRYIDSNICEVVGIEMIKRENPDCKIIVSLNRPKRNWFLNQLGIFFEALVHSWMHGRKYFVYPYKREKEFRKEFKKMKNDPNIILIYPKDRVVSPGDTKREELLQSYELGKRMAKEALEGILK